MSFSAWLAAHEAHPATVEYANWMDRYTATGVLGPAADELTLVKPDGTTLSEWIGHVFAVRCANGDERVCAKADTFEVDYDDPWEPITHQEFCPIHDQALWRIRRGVTECPKPARDVDGWTGWRFNPSGNCSCGEEAVSGLQWFNPDAIWDRTVMACNRCVRRGTLGPPALRRIRVGSRVQLTSVPEDAFFPELVVGAEGVVTWTLYDPGNHRASIRVQFAKGDELTLNTDDGFELQRISTPKKPAAKRALQKKPRR